MKEVHQVYTNIEYKQYKDYKHRPPIPCYR